jgi:hypothetical protein
VENSLSAAVGAPSAIAHHLPSLQEEFGNTFLEAACFRRPLLIKREAIRVKNTEPRGFDW